MVRDKLITQYEKLLPKTITIIDNFSNYKDLKKHIKTYLQIPNNIRLNMDPIFDPNKMTMNIIIKLSENSKELLSRLNDKEKMTIELTLIGSIDRTSKDVELFDALCSHLEAHNLSLEKLEQLKSRAPELISSSGRVLIEKERRETQKLVFKRERDERESERRNALCRQIGCSVVGEKIKYEGNGDDWWDTRIVKVYEHREGCSFF